MNSKNVFLESIFGHPLMMTVFYGFNKIVMRLFLAILLLVSGSGVVNAEWVDKIIDVQALSMYNDNLSHGIVESAERDDMLLIPSLVVGRTYQLADFTRVMTTVNVKGQVHKDFDELNSIFGQAMLAVSHKLGVGPYNPWLRGHVSGGYLEVKDDLRDSWLLDTGIKVGKRLHERIDVEAGYVYDYRDGKDSSSPNPNLPGTVFDQDGHKGSVLSNFLLTNNLLLSLGYSVRHGDIASTCNGEVVETILDKMDAITLDTSYNEDLCTYRVRATVQEFLFGTTYALSGHASLNLNYNRIEGEAASGDIEYSGNIVNVNVNYSF